MERLIKDKLFIKSIQFGILANFSPICGMEMTDKTNIFLNKVFNKLEEYENTGIEPEEVRQLKDKVKYLEDSLSYFE